MLSVHRASTTCRPTTSNICAASLELQPQKSQRLVDCRDLTRRCLQQESEAMPNESPDGGERDGGERDDGGRDGDEGDVAGDEDPRQELQQSGDGATPMTT